MKSEYQLKAIESAKSSLAWAKKFKAAGDYEFYALAVSHLKIHRAESK
jgi:hypothetical protein